MKKSLFLLAALAVGTSATVSAQKLAATALEEASGVDCHFLTSAEVKKMVAAKGETAKAWYNRPKGCFYVLSYVTDATAGSSSYYAPYVHVKPYSDVTFLSASTDAVSTSWNYWKTEKLVMKKNTAEGDKITFGVSLEVDTIPEVTAVGSDGVESVYGLKGYNGSTQYYGHILAYPNYPAKFDPNYEKHAWSSSKFFAAKSNRDGTKTAGVYYGSVKDADGNAAGKLMGKNTVGINGFGTAFDYDASQSYAVRSVGVRVQNLALTSADATADVTATIYALNEIPEYGTTTYSTLTLGKVIAKKTIALSDTYITENPQISISSSSGKGLGYIYFELPEVVEINGPVFVAITGLNGENVSDATALYSSDYFDEGYGELGYVLKDDKWIGMYKSYLTVKTAPSVYLEVERPVFVWNSNTETGEYQFDALGESREVEVFSTRASSAWKVTTKDGLEVPAWVGLTMTDDMTAEEYNYLTTLKFNVAALPEGVEARDEYIELSCPGAALEYHVVQKKEVSGVADVKMTGIQARVEGGNIVLNTTADGAVSIYNVAGQLVGSLNVTQGTSTINASNLASGVYFVNINGKTVKVVK